MSFDEEWAQLKSNAPAPQDTSQMRLNQVDPGDGGYPGRIRVTSSELRRRADKADTVRDDFVKADNAAMTETKKVGESLKGFKSGPAFNTLVSRWEEQMKYVEGLLVNDVAGAFRATAANYEVRDEEEADRYGGGKGGGSSRT